jgi:membrane protein YdbS with pleckstrin-like domain
MTRHRRIEKRIPQNAFFKKIFLQLLFAITALVALRVIVVIGLAAYTKEQWNWHVIFGIAPTIAFGSGTNSFITINTTSIFILSLISYFCFVFNTRDNRYSTRAKMWAWYISHISILLTFIAIFLSSQEQNDIQDSIGIIMILLGFLASVQIQILPKLTFRKERKYQSSMDPENQDKITHKIFRSPF